MIPVIPKKLIPTNAIAVKIPQSSAACTSNIAADNGSWVSSELYVAMNSEFGRVVAL